MKNNTPQNTIYDSGNIYLIRNTGNQNCKIGYTFKMTCDDRLRELQCGSSDSLEVLAMVHVSIVGRVVEMVKQQFAGKRVSGSWFALDARDIIDFEATCRKQEEVAKKLFGNPFFNKYYDKYAYDL